MTDRQDSRSSYHPTLPAQPAGLVEEEGSAQVTMDGATLRSGGRVSSMSKVDAYSGTTLEGRYAIESLLGEGGMGVVYLGRHKVIDPAPPKT